MPLLYGCVNLSHLIETVLLKKNIFIDCTLGDEEDLSTRIGDRVAAAGSVGWPGDDRTGCLQGRRERHVIRCRRIAKISTGQPAVIAAATRSPIRVDTSPPSSEL